jgi:hypothetical protein
MTQAPSHKPKRASRRPSLAPLIKQATEAGATVSGAIVRPDGSVALTFAHGKPGYIATASNGSDANEWDGAQPM